MIRAGAFKNETMEKAIFTESSPIYISPEPANAGHETRPEKDFREWERSNSWRDPYAPTYLYWRKASMEQAFSTFRPASQPGAPWHEVASLGLSPWAVIELRDIAYIRESQGREIAFRLGLTKKQYWRCGEGGNRCNCSSQDECGYIEIHNRIEKL